LNKIIQEDLKFITKQKLPWGKLKNKAVFISGAGGFLGSYIVYTLLYLNQKKKLNINILANVRDYKRAKDKFGEQKGLDYCVGDINEIFSSRVPIDYIIHTASLASPKYFEPLPVQTILPNIIGTNNLLEIARERLVEKFLFVSTSGVLGFHPPEDYPLFEDDWGVLDPTDEANCYLEAKRMGEALCIAYKNQYQVPVVIARPGGFYGPGLKLDDGRVFADLIANIVRKEDLVLYSDGQAIRDYLYITDVITGIFTILFKGEIGSAYNVTSTTEINILDLAKKLAYEVFPELGLKVVIKEDSTKNFLRVKFQKTSMGNDALKRLGWMEHFYIEDGFRRTVKSWTK
jgi:nucleoside-diphosphate-sugar epimerase